MTVEYWVYITTSGEEPDWRLWGRYLDEDDAMTEVEGLYRKYNVKVEKVYV